MTKLKIDKLTRLHSIRHIKTKSSHFKCCRN